jgi:hypothetical protein
MPDFHSPEDEATLYVLGELTAAERREFEARMAKSTELRQRVRELEEGAVALSTGLPQRRPPPEVWSGIEKALGRQRKPEEFGGWGIFWRNGWAAAALCLLGWLFYAILLNGRNTVKTAATVPAPAHETIAANVPPAAEHAVSSLPPPTNTERQLLQVRAQEISNLQFRIATLAQATNELSQLLTVEQARLNETNRIKFYQFASASTSGGDAAAPQLSPAMQRAVLVSIGRELGLLPMATQSRVKNGHIVNTVNGIDFVDLRPSTGNQDNPPPNQSNGQPNQQPIQPANQAINQLQETQVADVTSPSIPAFVSGDKLIVGLDSTIAPPNSSVILTVTDASYQTAAYAFSMGDNPAMITLPYQTISTLDGEMAISIGWSIPAGMSNVIRFLAPANP